MDFCICITRIKCKAIAFMQFGFFFHHTMKPIKITLLKSREMIPTSHSKWLPGTLQLILVYCWEWLKFNFKIQRQSKVKIWRKRIKVNYLLTWNDIVKDRLWIWRQLCLHSLCLRSLVSHQLRGPTWLWLPPIDATWLRGGNLPSMTSLSWLYFMDLLDAHQTISMFMRLSRTLSLLVTKCFLCETLRHLLSLFITMAEIQSFHMIF